MEEKKEIQSPDDITEILKDIRNRGRTNDDSAKKLLGYLTGKQKWTHEQCLNFYESIIYHYLDDEGQRNLILAVSGRLDGYKSLSNASQCRNKYLENQAKNRDINDKQADVMSDTILKREGKYLGIVAKGLYDDFNNRKRSPLLKQWIKGKPQKTNTIKASLRKSINEKPQYWLLSTIIIFLILVFSCSACLAHIYMIRQSDALWKLIEKIADPENEKPPIEKITVNPEITLAPGQKKDLELNVSPDTANLADLHCKIDDENIVAVTNNWEAVGLGGCLETESAATIITFWSGEAEPVNVNVIVVKSGNRSNDSDLEYYIELD